MAERAKLFMNGGSQAVRLPKSVRFPDDVKEVVVRRDGNKVILEDPDEWRAEFLAMLGTWGEDIPLPRRNVAKPRDPFSIPLPKTGKRGK